MKMLPVDVRNLTTGGLGFVGLDTTRQVASRQRIAILGALHRTTNSLKTPLLGRPLSFLVSGAIRSAAVVNGDVESMSIAQMPVGIGRLAGASRLDKQWLRTNAL